MRRTIGLIVAVSVLVTAAVSAQQAALPFGNLVSAAGEQIADQCVRLLDAPPSPNELLEREAEMSRAVFCDCMPPAIAGLAGARAPETPIGTEEFGALVLHEFDVCGAKAVRETTRRDCAKFTPPNAPPTYCMCFAEAVDRLTDEQIIADSIEARDNLEQRREARRNATPEAPLLEGLMSRIDRECRLQTPAQ